MDGPSKDRSIADPRLLEIIDKLFELNIGDYVSLPHLLVVGDQSSGKSSVLEGLTGLPFPRDSGLCTRFATQITFRRTPQKKITISIIPAVDAEESYARKLRAWVKADLQTLGRTEFSDAQELMGVGLPSEPGQRTFSDDVLKIEICGPDQQHLSVVDVPGIFRSITEGITTQRDKVMVRDMIVSYMENPRSVILAVIPANVDIATQEILDMAHAIDTKKQRTLGVLTKPDLVDKGAHDRINALVEGKSHPLTLGWSMVRNPGQQDLKNESYHRHAEERDFFKTDSRYNKLPADRLGIVALESRLGEILAEIVRREFPHVKTDISKQLAERRREPDQLGMSRETQEQQRKYLSGLAARFQNIASLAIRAHYGGDDAFDKYPMLKLASMVINRNDIFARDIAIRGHAVHFMNHVDAGDSEDEKVDESKMIEAKPTSKFDDKAPLLLSKAKPKTANRYACDHDELDDLRFPVGKVAKPLSTNIIEWLQDIYNGSRGFELGTFDASIIPTIWKKQVINWDAIALGYIMDIVSLVHGFVRGLLRICSADDRVRVGLLSIMMEDMTTRYKNAIVNVKFLLVVEKEGIPLTANHYFSDNLEKCRQKRMKDQLQRNAFTINGYGQVVSLSNIVSTHTMSNAEHTVRDIHDILKSYYKVARKRFVDDVCKQAADYHLIAGPDTPIKVFSPTYVQDLSAEQLESIAGEDVFSRRRRAELKTQIANLEAGRKVLI